MEREKRIEDMRLEAIKRLTQALYWDLRKNRIAEVSELEESLRSDHEEATMEARFRRALKALIALLLMKQRGAPEGGRDQVQDGSAKENLKTVQWRPPDIVAPAGTAGSASAQDKPPAAPAVAFCSGR